jgi:hypothetical protein
MYDSLLPNLLADITECHAALVLHDSAPGRDFRDDDELLHTRKRRRLVFVREGQVSVPVVGIVPASLACIICPLVRKLWNKIRR